MTPERLSTWLLPSGWETGAAPRTADEAAAQHRLTRDARYCQCVCGCLWFVGPHGPLCLMCFRLGRKGEHHGRQL